VGADRPGIVNALAERAERHGANWCASRMTRLAGEFAGMVHFEVPPAQADALANALQGLESLGLKVLIARSADGVLASGLRSMELELVGEDRAGIVARLTRTLAERGISIENIHTELLRTGLQGRQTFKVGAHLLVPQAQNLDALRTELGALAHALMVDIALDERAGSAPA
jgi:methionyl-tRNA formyltransferase